MKHLLSLLITFSIATTLCFAQVKVDSGNTSVEMTLKRCITQGNDVILDFVVICRTDVNHIAYFQPDVYDDEGNLYNDDIFFEIDGKRTQYRGNLKLEKDIPRKLRLIIHNVDEYASSFLLIKIPYDINGGRNAAYIRNLPITRE